MVGTEPHAPAGREQPFDRSVEPPVHLGCGGRHIAIPTVGQLRDELRLGRRREKRPEEHEEKQKGHASQTNEVA